MARRKRTCFSGLDYILENFTDFWNLLSFEAIQKGSLDEEFGPSERVPRKLDRVIDRLFNSDLPLQRNRLHSQLHPMIVRIFEDIANQDPVEILDSCYVHVGSLKIVAQDLNIVITDAVPNFLENKGRSRYSKAFTMLDRLASPSRMLLRLIRVSSI